MWAVWRKRGATRARGELPTGGRSVLVGCVVDLGCLRKTQTEASQHITNGHIEFRATGVKNRERGLVEITGGKRWFVKDEKEHREATQAGEVDTK